MVEQWLIFRQDQQFGPYRWEEVLYHARSGRIEPSDILWRSQGGLWLWASQVPGLLSPDFSRPEKRPTVHKRRILIAANGILSLLLVLSLIFLLLPPRIQDFPETSETETSVAGTEAPAPAPAILIEHPSGLLLDAPEGAYKADTVLVVSTSNEGPATTPFEQRGPAYVIESLTLDIADKPVTIDLPVDSREGNQVVLFLSMGSWLRIPNQAVT